MSSLEEKIRQLMEGKSEDKKEKEGLDQDDTKGKTADQDDADQDDADQDDEDQDDADQEGKKDQDDTDLAKDTKKDKITVKESAAPGQIKDLEQDDSESTQVTNSKIKLGLGKKDTGGKIKNEGDSADKQDDAGANAKIQKGSKLKDTAGKLEGSSNKKDPANEKNAVVSQNEHMEALFQGEELSEEFQSKAVTIFEAAVAQAAQEKAEQLEEEYAQHIVSLQEEIEESVNSTIDDMVGELVEQVDGYLDAVVEQWVESNQIALEGSIKTELVNSFIDGLKGLFKEHYVEIPEDKISVIEEQAEQIEQLQTKMEEMKSDNVALVEQLIMAKAELVFEQVAEGLTGLQTDKFMSLAEKVEFVNEEDYKTKLSTIKESYFPQGKIKEVVKEEKQQPAADMNAYVDAIAKNIKF